MRFLKVSVVISALLIAGRQLVAQEALTAPGAETSTQAETTTPPEGVGPADNVPVVDANIEPIVQTSPDDGTTIAGADTASAQFEMGRRFHFSARLTGGYDDNVNLTPTGSPSWYASPTVVATYLFGSSRIALTAALGGGVTYYFDRPNGRDYDPNVYLRLSLAYRASPRLTIDFSTLAAYQAQPDFTTEFSANRRLGNFFRSLDTISVDYRWTPRLSLISSYRVVLLYYESSVGAFQNRIEQALRERVRFLWLPTTALSGEYTFKLTTYENAPRDSMSHIFAAGLEHTFSPRLEASLRGGVQFRMADTGADRTSPYAEGTVRYTVSRTTLVSWTNRYSIEESDSPGASSRTTFRTHLQLAYAITPRISTSLALTYLHSGDERGTSSSRDIFDIGPTVRYSITHNLSVNVGYRHTELDRGSNSTLTTNLAPFGSYTRNRYFAGLNWSF